MQTIQVDGGLSVASHDANSVGVVYPAQRVDYVLSWPASAIHTDTELQITIDNEYYVVTMFHPPSRSIPISAETSEHQSSYEPINNSFPELVGFNLREARGPRLDSPLPEPDSLFMIYAVVEILSHNKFIPKGYINHTYWVPQELPLLSLKRDEWDNHQLAPWTGSKPVWVELTINNIDTQGHPFHLVRDGIRY